VSKFIHCYFAEHGPENSGVYYDAAGSADLCKEERVSAIILKNIRTRWFWLHVVPYRPKSEYSITR